MYIYLCIFVCLCLYYANVVKKFYHVNKINQSLQKNNSKWNNGYKSKTIKNKVKVKLVILYSENIREEAQNQQIKN